jgi:uncharacterized protein involved in exopolysaccharide biosynthesis
MRQRALSEASHNVAYLRDQLAVTSVISIQQSISNLLEADLQRLMLAQGTEEFSFRIIDRAHVPKEPSYPNRAILILVAVILGIVLSILFALARHAIDKREEAAGAAESRQ